jgi:hypothetical protein
MYIFFCFLHLKLHKVERVDQAARFARLLGKGWPLEESEQTQVPRAQGDEGVCERSSRTLGNT